MNTDPLFTPDANKYFGHKTNNGPILCRDERALMEIFCYFHRTKFIVNFAWNCVVSSASFFPFQFQCIPFMKTISIRLIRFHMIIYNVPYKHRIKNVIEDSMLWRVAVDSNSSRLKQFFTMIIKNTSWKKFIACAPIQMRYFIYVHANKQTKETNWTSLSWTLWSSAILVRHNYFRCTNLLRLQTKSCTVFTLDGCYRHTMFISFNRCDKM